MESTKSILDQIQELEVSVIKANTADLNGRQIVANGCKSLYNLVEEDAHNAGCDWMLQGIYKDLCSGNFAEPFLCEQKKNDFLITKKIYQDRILPRL